MLYSWPLRWWWRWWGHEGGASWMALVALWKRPQRVGSYPSSTRRHGEKMPSISQERVLIRCPHAAAWTLDIQPAELWEITACRLQAPHQWQFVRAAPHTRLAELPFLIRVMGGQVLPRPWLGEYRHVRKRLRVLEDALNKRWPVKEEQLGLGTSAPPDMVRRSPGVSMVRVAPNLTHRVLEPETQAGRPALYLTDSLGLAGQ